MHARRAHSPFTAPAVQRCVLVLLTLVASLMHLTRTPGAGGLGLTPPPVSQPVVSRPALQASAPAGSAAQLQTDHAADHMPDHGAADHVAADHRAADHVAGSHAGHAPTDAAPNAPPGHAEHAGPHCPFCLTAGFALAAAPATTLPTVPAPVVRPAGPAVSAVRHADPPAPPALG